MNISWVWLRASRFTARVAVRLPGRFLGGSFLLCLITGASGSPVGPINSLAQMQDLASAHHQWIAPVAVNGLVCAAEPDAGLVALRDDSAVVLLQVPHLDRDVQPGDRLAIEGANATLTENAAGVSVGTAPVVEIDGLHPPVARAGQVFLPEGWQPIRLDWFNGEGSGLVEVAYEGPGVPLQPIPDQALRCGPGAPAVQSGSPGLNFAVYLGQHWTALPDFSSLAPTETGVIPHFDVGRCAQTPSSAMQFSGFLRIAVPGIYTFHLRSDDGARLLVGDPATQCTVTKLERASTPPTPQYLAQVLAGHRQHTWVSLEGTVTFAARRGRQIELKVVERGQSASVLIASAGYLANVNLIGQRIQMTGICELPDAGRSPRVIVPGANECKLVGTSQSPPDAGNIITTIAQVRGLQPDEARGHLHALVRGVVTTATAGSCVLQDATGSVFVRAVDGTQLNQPAVGEIWEVEGGTDPGEFSPIINCTRAVCLGRGILPEPIHPSWEQLMNGSLDVELVELSGLVLAATPSELTLLTSGGKIGIMAFHDLSLPYATALLASNQTLIGSLVHVQGVLFTCRDPATQQLIPGRIILGDGLISVDELTPADSFSTPTRHVVDLLRFTSHIGVMTRFKVSAQVLHARPPEYFLHDGGNSFRALTKESVPLAEGDLVEIVGFPQLGGPSPVLLEAEIRKVGHASLPPARRVAAAELTDGDHDATLVQVDAVLLSATQRFGEQILEMQAGQHHFLAHRKTEDAPVSPPSPGSQLRLTGVYAVTPPGLGSTLDGFQLLLTGTSDIVVLKRGPWLTPLYVSVAMVVLLAGLMVSLIWAALLRRTVAQRTVLLEREIRTREQTERHRLLEQERARVAQDLHDDLGAGLAQIGLLGSLVQRPGTAPERARGLLSEITDKSREMVKVLDEIVWAMNPKHDAARSVSGYLCDYAQEFFGPTAIACQFEVDCAQSVQVLNSTQRHQLFLAFKEALTNVVKHARATQVWVRITATVEELRVAVEDDGRGMPIPLEQSRGNGLLNMRARLAQIGGRCENRPRPGGGTLVAFCLPNEVEGTVP